MNHLLSIPEFKVIVRAEYLYNLTSHHGEYVAGLVHSVKAMYGRALGFNVLLESGACFWNLPVSAILWKSNATVMHLHELELWDCLASEMCCEQIEFLKNKRCTVKIGDIIRRAMYRMTFDFSTGPWAEMPEEAKCFHLLELDCGHFALQPNNRILWQDQAIVLKPSIPDYKVNSHVWISERGRASNDDKYFYEVE